MRLHAHQGLIIATTLAAGPAMAAMTTYYHAGVWDAFSGRGDNGEAVCGAGTTNPNDGRAFSLRWQIGGTQLLFRANKPSWQIADGTPITVVMQIGTNVPWTSQATGRGTTVSWTFNSDMIEQFDQQFRRGTTLTVSFPSGNEPPWALSLAGSTTISNTFGRCVTDLSRQANLAPPQPVQPADQQPAQPLGQTGTQPTQPDTQGQKP